MASSARGSRLSSRHSPQRVRPRVSSPRRVAVAMVSAATFVVTLSACSGAEQAPKVGGGATKPSASAGPRHDSTGDRSELVSDIPVMTTATDAGKRVVYSQRIEVQEGQLLLAVTELQVTNDLPVNVFVGSQVLLAKSSTGVVGTEITAANGENVTPDMHHGQQTKSGTYEAVRVDAGTRYVNVVAWAAASGAAPGDALTVDAGYGRLSVVRW